MEKSKTLKIITDKLDEKKIKYELELLGGSSFVLQIYFIESHYPNDLIYPYLFVGRHSDKKIVFITEPYQTHNIYGHKTEGTTVKLSRLHDLKHLNHWQNIYYFFEHFIFNKENEYYCPDDYDDHMKFKDMSDEEYDAEMLRMYQEEVEFAKKILFNGKRQEMPMFSTQRFNQELNEDLGEKNLEVEATLIEIGLLNPYIDLSVKDLATENYFYIRVMLDEDKFEVIRDIHNLAKQNAVAIIKIANETRKSFKQLPDNLMYP